MDTATQVVAELQQELEILVDLVRAAQPNGRGIQQAFLALQQRFQTQLLPLAETALQAQQPVLTEMNRTLRLLGTDVAFLHAARQSLTVQRRQRQMCDRISRLQQFCQALAMSPET